MKHVAEPATDRVLERRAVHHPPPTEPASAVSAERGVSEPTAKSVPPLSMRTAVLLQRQAGNRATARLFAQRQKTTAVLGSGGCGATAAERSARAGPATAGVDGLAVQRQVPGPTLPKADPEAVLGQRLMQDFSSGVAVAFYAPMPREKEEARNAAEKWAGRESALGIQGKAVTASNIVFGKAIAEAEHPLAATLLALGKVLTAAVAKAPPTPDGPTPPGMGASTVRTLAIFAHGTSDWCGLGAITSSTAASVIKTIAPTLAPDVTVVLYSCNAGRDPDDSEEWVKGTMRGGGAKSLAARTRDALIAAGKGGSVWGHTTTGHVTENFALREFSTTAGKGSAGSSFVASFVFTGPDKVETASELLDGVIAQGYEVTSPRAQADADAVTENQMYRCYAAANRELLFKGGKLAESAPVHPVEVGEVIKDYWTNTYWPANKSKVVDKLRVKLIAARRAKKAASGARP